MSEALDIFLASKKEIPDISYVLPGSGEEIFMRPFTTKEQKAILKALEKEDHVLLSEAFDQLLKNCVTNKDFNPDKLLSKDRECLLIKLRQESVKEDFIYNWKCSKCEAPNTHKINLSDLSFEKIVNKDSLQNKELALRDRPITLILGMALRGDEKKIFEYAKKNSDKKDISQAELINAAFAAIIKGVKVKKTRNIKDAQGNDKPVEEEVVLDIPFADRVKILDDLNMDDKNEIKKYLEGVDKYGFNLSLGTLKCKKCENESEESMEWLSFFMV